MIKRVALALTLLLAAVAVTLWWANSELERWMDQPLNIIADTVIELQPGENLTRLARRLEAEGIVSDARFFQWYLRVNDAGHSVHAGEYLLIPRMTPRDLLDALVTGRVIEYSITLPEGRTLRETLQTLHDDPRLEREISAEQLYEPQQWLGPEFDFPAAEGAFFPDTYRYHRGQSDADILRRAWQAMRRVIDDEWAERADGLPLNSPWEAIILASIIERESGHVDERARIAGVFIRRLNKQMRLQTDPTVIYGLGDEFDGNLTRKHLRTPGPYNTYMNMGLPPTPIALPGRASIHAALHPSDDTALYFVARGDGSHAFSATLSEHRAAVRQYQLKRRKDYHSSPAKQ